MGAPGRGLFSGFTASFDPPAATAFGEDWHLAWRFARCVADSMARCRCETQRQISTHEAARSRRSRRGGGDEGWTSTLYGAGSVIDLQENLGAALDRYPPASGFTPDSYSDPNFPIKILFLTLNFPNPGLLPFHDLHHVATGYDSSFLGESEISVFELRAGCGKPLI